MSEDRKAAPAYLIFDIEAIADGELVSRIRYPGQNLPANDAVAKYRAELMEDTGRDFTDVLEEAQAAFERIRARGGLDDVFRSSAPRRAAKRTG